MPFVYPKKRSIESKFMQFYVFKVQANCAVCKADDGGATALSSSVSCKDLYGTQGIGLYGKIRSWKSVSLFSTYLLFLVSFLLYSLVSLLLYSFFHCLLCSLKGRNPSNVGKADGA